MSETQTLNQNEKPISFRRKAMIATVVSLVVAFILWNTPAFNPIMYPVRLFVTFVHEMFHGLVAILTGGEIIGFTVSSNGAGLATTAGGSRALILPAGYVGAAFFGAVLFYLANTIPYTRFISMSLGAGLIVFTILFARPDHTGIPVALIVGLVSGALLIFISRKASQFVNLIILNVLAMLTSLNAVFDLIYLIQLPSASAGNGQVRNDASAFSSEIIPILPPAIIALIWVAISLFFMALSVYYSILRPMRRKSS